MPRADYLLDIWERQKSTAQSLGVRNRQPQGQLMPFSFSGADVFDDTDTMDVLVYVPDGMYVCTAASAFIRFRQFFASAKDAASGGGATSGNTTISSNLGLTAVGGSTGAASTGTAHTHVAGSLDYWMWDSANPHTHSTPAHTHSLTYGVYKETMPASHSVTLKIYNWDDDAAWDLVHTFPGITTDTWDQDLTLYITGPGIWRLELKSDAAQPNGGRLGCDVAGFVFGAVRSV